MDYDAFVSFSKISNSAPDSFDYSDYETTQSLKTLLAEHLENYPHRKNLMGLSAKQLGIPVNAIYIKYDGLPKDSSLFLLNPKIKLIEKEKREFVLKLVRCPSSPVSLNLGVFNREFVISSENSRDINLYPFGVVEKFDPFFDFSANVQRIIWSNTGALPGDPFSVPMNYTNISKVIENREDIKEQFRCVIHQSEIQKIAENFAVSSDLSLRMEAVKDLIENLIVLSSNNIDKEWIMLPAVNLYKKNSIKSLYTI